jgi:hypothetical protein
MLFSLAAAVVGRRQSCIHDSPDPSDISSHADIEGGAGQAHKGEDQAVFHEILSSPAMETLISHDVLSVNDC